MPTKHFHTDWREEQGTTADLSNSSKEKELYVAAGVISTEKYFFKNPIFQNYTYLLVFLPPLPPVLSMFSLFFLFAFETDKIKIALLLASFSYKSGFYFPAWKEKLTLVKLRPQYTGNLDSFRVCFVFLWYRKTVKQRAQFMIKALC